MRKVDKNFLYAYCFVLLVFLLPHCQNPKSADHSLSPSVHKTKA